MSSLYFGIFFLRWNQQMFWKAVISAAFHNIFRLANTGNSTTEITLWSPRSLQNCVRSRTGMILMAENTVPYLLIRWRNPLFLLSAVRSSVRQQKIMWHRPVVYLSIKCYLFIQTQHIHVDLVQHSFITHYNTFRLSDQPSSGRCRIYNKKYKGRERDFSPLQCYEL